MTITKRFVTLWTFAAILSATAPTLAAPPKTLQILQNDQFTFITDGGDWDPGFEKATCSYSSQALGMWGISINPLNGFLHGIACADLAPNGISPLGVYRGPISGTPTTVTIDNSNHINGHHADWDFGFFKDECPDDVGVNKARVVVGLSQVASSGTMHKMLCENIFNTANLGTCSTVIPPSGGIVSYATTQGGTAIFNFAAGYNIGACGNSRNVVGISHDANLRPHAILCCSP